MTICSCFSALITPSGQVPCWTPFFHWLLVSMTNDCLHIAGWNHRGVYILSRDKVLSTKIKRKLSPAAHRRMRMDYHRYNILEMKFNYFTKRQSFMRKRCDEHELNLSLGKNLSIEKLPFFSKRSKRYENPRDESHSTAWLQMIKMYDAKRKCYRPSLNHLSNDFLFERRSCEVWHWFLLHHFEHLKSSRWMSIIWRIVASLLTLCKWKWFYKRKIFTNR